ncbi:protamine-2 isoform X1 [Gorilla gorilla gorilla]|uniref:protamine-2 isoform X1 n=1 Tax=Gorilla gorilla gorilla TaxID=9595 RepID=UPI000016C235|nr:protamine-2 isoform X1 [Gorilla gorilla gorilla]AAF34631.1 protamine 2 [Gorilla gorilla]
MVRCRVRSPSERSHEVYRQQLHGQEQGHHGQEEQGLSPEHVEVYERTHGHSHYRRRHCSQRRLRRIHRQQHRSCRRRKRRSCRHRRRHRKGCRTRRRTCRRH